jgi:glyoxylase-like metal-dependent hydrolase (beta-lactamase superfamily II)
LRWSTGRKGWRRRDSTPSTTANRTGHLLFPGGVGNTQKDPARFDSLYAGVVAKIFGRLPDATWVYPGHGADTTLGAERPHLKEWRERGW